MNIRRLPKGTTLFEYSQLSEASKDQARDEIINDFIISMGNKFIEWDAMNKRTKKAKQVLLGLRQTKQQVQRMQEDVKFCEKVICENACIFTESGIYITYII